jgi:hypothetical protein
MKITAEIGITMVVDDEKLYKLIKFNPAEMRDCKIPNSSYLEHKYHMLEQEVLGEAKSFICCICHDPVLTKHMSRYHDICEMCEAKRD